MSHEPLPSERAEPVARACAAFEADWNAGARPDLAANLKNAPATFRAILLEGLLRIELTHRLGQNESPGLDEYLVRFPNDADVVRAAFRDTPTGGVSPLDPAATVLRPSRTADHSAVPGYELLELLPPGGMGVVYKARRQATGELVALKMIRAGAHAGPEERARFRVEVEAVASLLHPNVVRILDHGECDGVPYLALEYVAGGSLAEKVASGDWEVGSEDNPRRSAALVETLARAVHFVHEQGIIHRDLKPANVLLQIADLRLQIDRPELASQSAIPKLADFGLAKRLDHDQGLTQSQAVLGTASYMAPEQAAGDRHRVGPGTDVYALGAILYELLTGRPPFRGDTRERTIQMVLSEEPQRPAAVQAGVPPELEAVCLHCLEKEPERRYGSALALAEDLARFRRGEPLAVGSLDKTAWHGRLARRVGYEIQAALPGGAYRARDLGFDRTVVLRMLDSPERLRESVGAAAKLRHPNVAEIYAWGDCDGVCYVASEFVEGKPLRDELTGPGWPAERIAGVLETLARALHAIHLAGLAHGALDEAKVLVRPDGTCKILGLGLAPSGNVAGDVLALGDLLYEVLAGRPLPSGDVAPEPPRHWRPEVPAELEAVCLRCLERDETRRYPSAAAVAEELRRFRAGEVLFIDDLDDWAQQKRWARRAGYEILEWLGDGRDCFSYKARQVALDRVVLLRRMRARDRFDPAAKVRFRRELHLLGGCRHPNVVRLLDHGEQNDLCYAVREFVEGKSLADLVAEPPADRVRTALRLVASLAETVHDLHSLGAVLGGLHPGRVRLSTSGVPRLTRLLRARPPADDERPARAAYQAPEQLEPRVRFLPAATDVYALGAILYALLTGRPPFRAPTTAALVEQIRTQAPEPPRQFEPAIPSEVEAICLQCLAKEAERRPASAQAIADALAE